MRFFKRGSSGPDPDAIPAFWRWWAGARHRVAAAIADGSVTTMVEEISKAVRAIDPRLAWELSKGAEAQHALIVTPEGNPAVRGLALTWLNAAPPADATWEYHASRQAGPLGRLSAGGVEVDLEDFRVLPTWEETRQRVDVRLWHPALAAVPDGLRHQFAFLFIDNLLGEDRVERWIGSIEVDEAATDGLAADDSRAEIDRLVAGASAEQWLLAERTGGRDPAIVLINMSVKPIDHPYRSHHLTVTVARGIEQLRHSDETPVLDAAEDRLVEALADADCVHIGHITEMRRRVIHFMCADPERARPLADGWAETERGFSPRVDVKPDPAWEFRREFGL